MILTAVLCSQCTVITVRRITSGELLKCRKGLHSAEGYGTPAPAQADFLWHRHVRLCHRFGWLGGIIWEIPAKTLHQCAIEFPMAGNRGRDSHVCEPRC